MDVLFDGVHKLGVLLGGVGVVHTQVADAAELLGGTEVDNQGLAVANMQVAVGLGRKAGVDLHPGAAASLGDVLRDKLVDKVLAFRLFQTGSFDFLRHGLSPPLSMGLFYTRKHILASVFGSLFRLHRARSRYMGFRF